MAGTGLLTISSVFLAATNASLIEDASGGAVAYQFDAGTFHDAPDTCEGALADWQVALGNTTQGMLVPVEDEADHIVFLVAPEDVGSRVTVAVGPAEVEVELSLDVWVPDCAGDVFAPENQPIPAPVGPVPPGPGETQASITQLDGGWTCDPTQWRFFLKGLGPEDGPRSIHVIWTDGSEADVAFESESESSTMRYGTTLGLGFTPQSVTANVPADWTGEFYVQRGPCDAQDGNAVYGEPPTQSGDTISFTPTTTGYYVAAILLEDPEAPEVPTSVPLSCHFCVDGTDELTGPLSYDLTVLSQGASA